MRALVLQHFVILLPHAFIGHPAFREQLAELPQSGERRPEFV